jgi:hypothetical protein
MGSGREARGKENPRVAYAVGFRTEPATLVRGSSRITIMRFRPVNIGVIRETTSPHAALFLCGLCLYPNGPDKSQQLTNRRNSRLDRDSCCLLRKTKEEES